MPRRCAALRSVLHLGIVQPIQLFRADPEGRRRLRRFRMDRWGGLRQRRAVALSDAAQSRETRAAGTVGPWRARQYLAVAGTAGTRVPRAGRDTALLRSASRQSPDRPGRRGSDPLLHGPCRGMALGQELAAGVG